MKVYVKKYRRLKKFNCKDLAKLLGISHSTLAQYEQGRRKLPVETAQKIGNVLQMNWWELYENIYKN